MLAQDFPNLQCGHLSLWIRHTVQEWRHVDPWHVCLLRQWCPNILCAAGDCYVKAYFGPTCWSLKRTWMLFRHNACTGLPKSAVWSFEPVDQTYCARMAACWPLTRLPTWGSGVPIFFVPQVIATSRLTLGLVVGLLKRTWMLFRHNACTGLPKSAVWSFEPVDQTYCARMAACWPLTRLPTWGSGVPIFFVPQVIATSRLTLGLVVGLEGMHCI